MNHPLARAKIDALLRFTGSVALMFVGFLVARGPMAFVGVIGAFFGMVQAVRHFRRLVWVLAIEQGARAATQRPHDPDASPDSTRGGSGWRGPWSSRWQSSWRSVSMPRRVFTLLYTVAEIDGRSGPREMDLVRRFLIERFLAPEILADLTSWSAPEVKRDQLAPLIASMRAELSYGECETVFWWCCMISLIDERFSRAEHDLLQDIARHFGMQSVHAARVFQHAKARVLEATRSGQRGGPFGTGGAFDGGGRHHHQGREGWHQQGRERWSGRQRRPSRTDPAAARRVALQVLGLDATADAQAIRKRHRELVKRYHPDAHASLGPVAAQEAAERFKEIQSAYETLTRN